MASLYPDTSMVIRMCLAVAFFPLGRMVSFHQLRVSTAKVAKSGLENLGSRTSTFVCRTIGANLSVALQ